MSRQINQPINQVRLTNVAVVRYNHGGKRFEIACYRNKVLDYRQGLESDLSEVLQTDRIFSNVSKGQFAKASDLQKCFGTRDEAVIAQRILQEGKSLQVSDLERQQLQEQTLTKIATWIANHCVHPTTKRPYTVSQVLHALSHYTVQPHKPLKKQYLDAVKYLQTNNVLPIERAKMELSLHYPTDMEQNVQAALTDRPHTVVEQKTAKDDDDTIILVVQVDPSYYRDWNDLAKSVHGRLEIVQQQVATDFANENEDGAAVPLTLSTTMTSETKQPSTSYNEDEPDEQLVQLEQKLAAVRMQVRGENDDDDEEIATPRKNQQRKAQKKSKKAKRREKEQAQIERERQQQQQLEDGSSALAQPIQAAVATQAVPNSVETASSSTTPKSCNTCGGSFGNAAEYRAHFRSDWHRFNQKLLLQGLRAVSEQEFLLCDADTFFAGN